MILAVDAGNTRIKWGLRDAAGQWITRGAAAVDELERAYEEWARMPVPTRIAIANVAGPAVRETVVDLIGRWSVEPVWLETTARACGVVNGYEIPTQLGVDRWAAAVAAWLRQGRECLVVMAGTATTVDVVDADGVFRGGLILPGLGLMKRALVDHTAALKFAPGVYRDLPRNTADAIESGCIHAQIGAIERMRRRLSPDAGCVISGGGAPALVPHLEAPVMMAENLVLEGVVALADAVAQAG
ncbi:MAG TPA: type III pantothenate kinase [Burkholderiales bacterium]|nr:type III pantothenate kinase [Burkholderiales bacterium]